MKKKIMLDLILDIAKSDDRIKAVYMNGSRANPNVEEDKYQDYDMVFVVTETASFTEDRSWIRKFGEIAIVQEPGANDLACGIEQVFAKSYTWLMLFSDGNRLDLTIIAECMAREHYLSDTLTVRLLDKDSILPDIPPASDKGYWIKAPSAGQYRGCCNEFWWCMNNVAKGIVRRQLPYAMRMYLEVVHGELDKMVQWHIGKDNSFSVSTGMWGKYFEKYLPPYLYEMYVKTYSGGDYDDLWKAVFEACKLFRILASDVAGHFDFIYCKSEDENTMDYLLRVKEGRI